VLEFNWCEVCTSRKHADKFKEIEAVESIRVYASEYEEVRDKTETLHKEAAKLVSYLDQLCHSHCSARFWKYSREVGRTYKYER